ncbi:integrase catalytic domain-containing protein [Trichonephila clavipes]|nr:integrase catalytic domain-containing protein [Trichonephila clavipes]
MNLRKFKTNLSELRKLWNENGIGDVCESDERSLKGKDLQLHIFCDASSRAFGEVAYFRYVTANDDIYTSFITAKSRVSPHKKLTLPRLELLGAVLVSKILKYLTLKFKFPILKFFLWSDSSIDLHWIKGKTSNYKQFVSKVIEIQSNSDPSDWHHCSGRGNPADYVSRGANLETIINSQFWMHGPQWLHTTENNWPKSLNCGFSSTDPCESEEQVFTFAYEQIPVGGRLQKSKFSYLQKHPIILPAKHYFVNLIMRDSHEKVFHGGVSETLLEIRERFWLIKWRQTVKNILKKCLICGRFSSTSGIQVTAPLPALGVEQSAPFSVVGIYFRDPLYTKDENKHYIVLFTCAVTRALHLELVNNLTTETFLLALRRFISRRGLCSKILTDNAKTFKKSELELKNLWKIISDPTMKAFYASHKIYWQFIIKRAPWWGGFYERLIRTLKLALRKTVGRATLFRDELETLLIEIEGILNSCPLTYIFSEFTEPEPLTPSHMILRRRVNSLPPARLNFVSNLSNRKVLIKSLGHPSFPPTDLGRLDDEEASSGSSYNVKDQEQNSTQKKCWVRVKRETNQNIFTCPPQHVIGTSHESTSLTLEDQGRGEGTKQKCFTCAAYGCNNSKKKDNCRNKTTFQYPLKNPTLLKTWIAKIRRDEFVPSSSVLYACFATDQNA